MHHADVRTGRKRQRSHERACGVGVLGEIGGEEDPHDDTSVGRELRIDRLSPELYDEADRAPVPRREPLAVQLVAEDHRRRSGRLLEDLACRQGAAEALRKTIGMPLWESFKTENLHSLENGRRALGDEAWEKALQEGRQMKMEDAIRLAKEMGS